ncbi:MAG: heparinase II/III-family protein, partial [Deltaproteobacteria bacterium]|nr:heparinase II/III-family protein [Deltaproteobacteria bacterium]
AFGMAAAPGHGHADCLSVELSVKGKPVLIDPGSYSWSRTDGWRNIFRSTRGHNTVVVDGQDQTPLRGMFAAGPMARPTLRHALAGETLRLIEASHDGYMRLKDPVLHVRTVIENAGDGWVIIDRLLGRGRHDIELFWHFDPHLAVNLEENGFAVHDHSGALLHGYWTALNKIKAEVLRGGECPSVGWVSMESGMKQPANVVRLQAELRLPFWIATSLAPSFPGSIRPYVSSLSCEEGIALRCESPEAKTTIFLSTKINTLPPRSSFLRRLKEMTKKHGQAPAESHGRCFGQWSSDAEIVVIREGVENSLLMINGRMFSRNGAPYLSFPTKADHMAHWTGGPP